MKKYIALALVSLLAFVGCKKGNDPEPQPVDKAPVVTLDKQSVEATAEGGEFTVNYTIENAKEGVDLTVANDAEWITDVTAAEGVISFTVAANEAEEAREATLAVEYTGAEARAIAVRQAAKDAPAMATIALEVENIIWNNADLKVTPSEDIEYVLGVMTKEKYASYENDEAIVAARVAEWESTAKMYQDMGYTDPWQYYLQLEQRSGENTYNIKDRAIAHLFWDTEYVAYVFGMDDEGVQTSYVAVKEFRTPAPEASENTFTITIDAMTRSSVEFTIEPTNDDPYYVTIESVDVLAPYGPDQEKSYDDLIKYFLPEYDFLIQQRVFAGKQTLTNEDFGKTINSFKTYKVIVWGFENGPTTDVYMSEAFKPADPVVDFEATISVDKCTHELVKYTVTPNSNNATYYHALYPAAEIGEDGGQALAEALIAEEDFAQKLVSYIAEAEVVVEPESDYYVLVFGYDANNEVMTSEVLLSELIHTAAVPSNKPTIDVEVTNLAWNGADIYITPRGDFKYYYECWKKSDVESRLKGRTFYDYCKDMWTADGKAYGGYDWLTAMGWYVSEGYGVADVGNLMWNTDYVFTIIGLNAAGEQVTDTIIVEFTTLAPTPSNNEFTVTINAMSASSVEFTVTPTTNDQYYVTVEKVATLSPYGPDKDKSYDDLIDYLLPDYENQLNQRLFRGEQRITNTDLGKSVSSFYEYQIVIWGFDNGPTTEIFLSEPFKPAN